MNNRDAATTQDETPAPASGVLAEFADANALVDAARTVRDAGYRSFDAFSPFPVHGIDAAIGIRRTRLPLLVLVAGIGGGVIALLLQWWTNAVDYRLLISGKPLFSLPANIPVTFELIVLLSAFAAFGGVFLLTGLPEFTHPLFSRQRFRKATTSGFFIAVDARDPVFDRMAVEQLLQGAGATAVENFGWPTDAGRRLPRGLAWVGAIAALVALLPPLYVAKLKLTTSDKPRIHLVPDMDHQAKYKTQAASALVPDNRTMRQPIPGTVAAGTLAADEHFHRGTINGAPAEVFPPGFQISSAMKRGREQFNIYCAACHGYVGAGDGLVSERGLARADSPAWIQPLSLHVPSVRRQPVGKIFSTITNGIRTMPAYRSQIAPADRWAIIAYVRALQRSQNASIDDVPTEDRARLQSQL